MLELTPEELLAKDHFMNLVNFGRNIPITDKMGWDFEFKKPHWFDVQKYDLGRQYFQENRAGILMTNMAGLILLLSVPTGLKILHGTGKSNTAATARDRYIDTVLHTISWYDYPLDNSTKSWESLKTVRRMHLHASHTSMQKNLGHISQLEVSMTTFGFAGFVLIRPHLFGIRSNDNRQREGFLHLWAVLNFMLGVRDEFNIGLLPLRAAEIEFDIIMRHVLAPFLQVESDLFKEMGSALVDGLRPFLPLVEYESQLFMTRRAVGIPGYQYQLDLGKERPHRNIFTIDDLKLLNLPVFSGETLLLVQVNKGDKQVANNSILDCNNNRKDVHDDRWQEDVRKYFDLPDTVTVTIKEISKSDREFMASLNDKNYNSLSTMSKIYLNMNLAFIGSLNSRMGKYLMEQILTLNLASMKRQQKNRRRQGEKT